MSPHHSPYLRLGIATAALAALLLPSIARASTSPVPRQTVSTSNLSALLMPFPTTVTRFASVSPSRENPATPRALGYLGTPQAHVVQDLSQLDNISTSNTSNFALFHQIGTSYLKAGVTGAVMASTSINLPDATQSAAVYGRFSYLATVYPTAADAQAYLQNAVVGAQNSSFFVGSCLGASVIDPSGFTYTNFLQISNPSCSSVIAVDVVDVNNDNVDDVYAAFQVGNVLVEDLGTVENFPNQVGATRLQYEEFFDDLATLSASSAATANAAAVGPGDTGGTGGTTPPPPTSTPTPTATPTNTPVPQPTIHLGTLQINRGTTSTTSLKAGGKYSFSASAQFANGGNNNPTAEIKFSRNGKVFEADPMTRVGAFSAHDGSQNVQFTYQKSFTHIKKTQNDSATVDVALGPATDTNSISFVLHPNCKAANVKKHGKTVKVKVCK